MLSASASVFPAARTGTAMPVFLDMEEQSCAAAGRRACTDVAKAFIETMERAGYRSGIYTNPNWLENYLYKAELVGKVNIWLAQWGISEPYCKCMLWQYAVGRSGTIRGIPGEIDLDYCYGGISDSTGSDGVSVFRIRSSGRSGGSVFFRFPFSFFSSLTDFEKSSSS